MNAEKKLAEMGIELSGGTSPVANYVSVCRTGNLLFLSGAGSFDASGVPTIKGKLGGSVSVEEGYQCARNAAIALISNIKREIGDLDKVVRVVKLVGFVASAPEFDKQPAVINGASDLFVDVFGDAGRHARSAVGVAALPMDLPVEVEAVVEVDG